MTGGESDDTAGTAPPPYPLPAHGQPSRVPVAAVARASWPASLAIGSFVVGVAGVLDTAPFWAICCGLAAVLVVHFNLPDPMPRLLTWTHTDAPRWTNHPRIVITVFFVLLPLSLTAAWAAASPSQLWNPWALFYGLPVGLHVFAFSLRRGGGSRPQRWWWIWLPLASLVILFFAVGGPFRARWAYCESRLTAAVSAGEPVEIHSTGRFCWHDAVERTVDGERRLYISGADEEGDGEGLVHSPSGAIERAPGIEMLRSLGGGWYYFEEGSPEKGFWFGD